MAKNVVFHGHFYQPVRLNPFIWEVEQEDSAYPFNNWNERLSRECYIPNAYAHIKDKDKVIDIINNYKYISFDTGYTLLFWLNENIRWLLEKKIKEGKTNGLFLTFNHTILPLDPLFEKEAQVYWGKRSYEYFMGERAFGCWIPELAVDYETLEVLFKYNTEFVILAPHQVKNNKKNYGKIRLKNGYIKAFIYNEELSKDISFGELLNDAKRLLDIIKNYESELLLIATDGETFGHHKKFGEMGLAYIIKNYELKTLNELSHQLNFDDELELVENTSWSCVHGIERWRSDCGCQTGGMPGWHQKWREPLRKALEFLRFTLNSVLDSYFSKININKESIVLNYIDVILGVRSIDDYLESFNIKDQQVKKDVASLLFAYLCTHFAFSSDAWFFADIGGIEVIHSLSFAKAAVDILKNWIDIEHQFLNILEKAIGNTEQRPNGKVVYKEDVLKLFYSKEDIAFTIFSLYKENILSEEGVFNKFSYTIEKEDTYFRVFYKDLFTLEEFLLELGSRINNFRISKNSLIRLSEKRIKDIRSTVINKNKDLILRSIEKLYKKERVLSEEVLNMKKFLSEFIRELLIEMIEENKTIEDILSIYTYIKDIEGINFKTPFLSKKLSKYLESIALELPKNEEKLYKALIFINELNKNESNYENMVGIWNLQNIIWDKKDLINNKVILELLHIL